MRSACRRDRLALQGSREATAATCFVDDQQRWRGPELCQLRLQRVYELALDDESTHLTVVQDECIATGGRRRVERDVRRTAGQRTEDRRHRVDRLPQIDSHAIAAPDARRCEPVPESPG